MGYDGDEIELGAVSASSDTAKPVPRPREERQAVMHVGEGPAPRTPLYLGLRAIEAMFADAVQHRERETGGLLAGDLCVDEDGKYLRVIGAVPAGETARDSTSITFGQQAWTRMLGDRERRFPGSRVVGWYHTHPRMRVFLSEPDRFIHRSFFGQPHDIAIVIDLHRAEWGVFHWNGDTIELARRFYIYGESAGDGARIPEILREFSARAGQ